MAGRKMATKKENRGGLYGGEEMATGLFYSPNFGYDLMQNCDLPPPMKVYAGQEKTIVSPTNAIHGTANVVGEKGETFGVNKDDNSEDEKLELLKALRLSQTRAREAEKKAAVLTKEKNDLGNFLLQQSMELFAYKQWVKMMEIRASNKEKTKEKKEVESNGAQSMTWLVAVAICVSIAGVGIFSFFSSSSSCHH